MIKPAQLYKSKLKEELLKSWYDPTNIYWSGWTGDGITDLPDDNYENHHFVSVDNSGNVIGYISYSVNWVAMSADNFWYYFLQKRKYRIR